MSYKNLRTSPGYAPSLAPCKGIRDSLVFSIPRHEFQIPGTGFHILCQWNLDSGFQWLVGFRIPWAVFWIQKPRIPDSRIKTLIPGFRFPQAKPSRIPDYTSKDSPNSGIRSPSHGASFSHRCIFILYPFFFRGSLIYRGYYMPARGYEFYVRVFNSISHSFAALTSEISSWTREDTIRIQQRACNILFII